ncbi:MAG: hypothetical protein ABSC77_04315 [Terracidiphilus sp.]|jgi:hypothetical protein
MPEPQRDHLVLEKRYRRLMVLTVCLMAAMLAQTAYTAWATRSSRTNGEILRARGLVITDDKGTARVIIGAPVQYTKRHMHGLFIADATGQERGGYVTDDQGGNALLTLDGQGFQTVLLLAEPDGDTMFKIWDQQHSSITMGANDNGPFLNLKREGSLVFTQPPGNALVSDPRPLFRY